MGMLIEGKWVDDDTQYRTASSGAFVRPQSVFTHLASGCSLRHSRWSQCGPVKSRAAVTGRDFPVP